MQIGGELRPLATATPIITAIGIWPQAPQVEGRIHY
jgi:hypothetical protein